MTGDLREASALVRESTQRVRAATSRIGAELAAIRERLAAVVARRALDRAVLLVDDNPAALLALVAAVTPLGVTVHAATDDTGALAALTGLGAVPHYLHDWSEVPGLTRHLRCAVVVIDEHLGSASGSELAARLAREVSVVVVSSRHEIRDALARAASVIHASSVIRTDTGAWADVLRDAVLRALPG